MAKELIKMEYYFTDGRVIFQGNVHARKQGKKADYLLHYSANNPIAIVEAKDNNKAVELDCNRQWTMRKFWIYLCLQF